MKPTWHQRAAGLLLLLALVTGLGQTALAQSFVHPGGLHTQADLDRMKTKVAAGEHPWIDGWNKFIADPKAQNTWRAVPRPNMSSRQRAQDDATAMYYNALRWYISGDKSYADCAVKIANAWSSTANQSPVGEFLSGIPVGSFALAGEVLRVYPGWAEADFAKFKAMLVQYWYPRCNDFLTTHGGSPDSRYWANWDACNMLAVLAIGVLCDDRAKFDQAVTYFKSGAGMGSIKNAVPFLYPGGLGQWQESGRDQAHTMGGMGLLSEFCQVAWNQGLDLFGYDDNRLLAGAEYTAQYTLWKGVPYTFYNNADNAKQYYISANYHGRLAASHFELLYNHYVVRQGLKAPNVKRFAELRRPEPGETDIFGHGTLTFTLDAAASPYPVSPAPPIPRDLTATAGMGRVDLKWSPSGAYSAQGYSVSRATASGGPYASIYSTTNWTTPQYTDTKVENGTTYHYVVAALNQVGASANSVPASATPVAGGSLPEGWTHASAGKADATGGSAYADVANGSFVVGVAGVGIGGAADDCNYAYRTVTGDFTLTARLINQKGKVNKMGLMMRETADANAKMLAMTLGEVGGRQARFGTRSTTGGSMTTQLGDDYTWLPVWFRLQRTGDAFTASQSSDGATWFTVGTSAVAMAKTYLVGLAASSGDNADASATAAFDNVMASLTPPTPPAAPNSLTATASSSSTIQLSWKNNATNQTGFKVEASAGNALFYEIADLDAGATNFVNTGLSDSTLTYRVRAYNTGGYSTYSSAVSAAKPTEASAPDEQ
jgi:regulation of enolase protein 1 (concanavalin A-like superfamily)